MRIETIEFLTDNKCIKRGQVIDFRGTGNYCALVGLNGSGKSSVVDAILESFKDSQYPDTTYIEYDKNVFPKLVVHVYNGETKFGSRYFFPKKSNNTIRLQLDSSIWLIACYLLQIYDDPLISYYNIKSEDIENLLNEKQDYRQLNFWENIANQIDIIYHKISKDNHILNIIYSYIKSKGHKNDRDGSIDMHSIDNVFLQNDYQKALQLSEGEKLHLVLTLIIKYLSNEETLILLDEPDAYLDIKKKKELKKMIESFQGQVVFSTHDPIMTKWMKDHLIFMKDGKPLPKKQANIISDISEGEVSCQETLLMLVECKHYVFAEGKTDIAVIKKAIEKLGYAQKFDGVYFLALGTSGAVVDKYNTIICDLLPKDTKKILFLFDADCAGCDGKQAIINMRKLKELTIDLEFSTGKEKEKIQTEIQNIAKKIDINNFDFVDRLTYYLYNKEDDFETKQDGDKNEWFYLEDYYSVNSYPEEYKVRKCDIQAYIKEPLSMDVTNNNEILKFHELLALEKEYKIRFFTKKTLKNYFKDNLHNINDPADFEGFRPLLDKILEKLELPNAPTA